MMGDTSQSDDEKRRRDIALFRYGLIAPVLHGTHSGYAAEYYRQVTATELEVPHQGPTRFSPRTVKGWLADYRAGGIDALMPKPRCDLGTFRVITPKVEQRTVELLSERPSLSATLVRELMVDDGLITSPTPSETTLRRFIRTRGLRIPRKESTVDRRAWCKEEPNELWSLDYMHGPRLEGSRVVPRLLAVIDDCSRFIVLGRFLRSESYADLAPCLVDAFSRHGLPLAIYCDNGASFSTRDLALTCARLRIALIHSAPGVPQGRGKIERFFRTVRLRFLPALDPEALSSVEAFDSAFTSWLHRDYHCRVHSSLDGLTPRDRFLQCKRPKRWVSRQEMEMHFYHTIHRKVRADSTLSVDGVRYEVPAGWIGHTVQLRSPLDDPATLTLFSEGEPIASLKPLDAIDNDRRHRRVAFASRSEDRS